MCAAAIHFDAVLASTTTDKRIEILRAIHQAGSISEAARVNGVSYKAAWQAVETLGTLAGVPLIAKAVGGSGGGGARLTGQGLQVLHAADVLHTARQEALSRIRGGDKATLSSALQPMAMLGLRTSMRNQLPCVVGQIQKVQGGARVYLELGHGQQLVARITLESLQLLGLRKGLPVLALCKAAAVTIAPTIVAMQGINLLKGQVVRRIGKKQDRQLALELSPGQHIAGFAQLQNDFKRQQAAMAAIEEAAIVIGLPS